MLVSVAQAPTTVPRRAVVVSAAPRRHRDVVGRLDVDLLQRLIEPAVAAVKILRAPPRADRRAARPAARRARSSPSARRWRRRPPTPRDRRRVFRNCVIVSRRSVATGAFVVASHAKFDRRRRRARRAARARPAAVAGPRADAVARARRRPAPRCCPSPPGSRRPPPPLPVLPAFGPIAPVQPPPARSSARYGQRARILPSTTPDPSQTVQGTSGICVGGRRRRKPAGSLREDRAVHARSTRYRRCVANGPSLTDSFSSRMPSGSASNNRTPPPTR